MQVKHADGRPTICINSPSQLAVLGNSVDFRLCKGMGEVIPASDSHAHNAPGRRGIPTIMSQRQQHLSEQAWAA